MKKILSLALAITLLLGNPVSVLSASSPWTQTDWSGGSGQTAWSDTSKYSSGSATDVITTAGQVTLTKNEKLSNTGFESDLTSWTGTQDYTLQDQFTTSLSAGSVNGTSAEPTGGTRTVTDTRSEMSISSGVLSFTNTAVTTGNPGIWYSGVSRTAGRTFIATLPTTDINGTVYVGFDTNQTGDSHPNGLVFNNSVLKASNNSVGVGSYTNTPYQTAVVLRSTGSFFFIKGGAFLNWTLLYVNPTGSESTLYPAIATTFRPMTADNVGVLTTTWLPTPIAYDTFTRSDGSIGSSETTGPDSQTTSALTWTGGAISSNKNVITPTLGSELVTNGGFDSDTSWTKGTGWAIGSGEASKSGATSSLLTQDILTASNWYYENIDVTSYTSGNLQGYIGGNYSSNLVSTTGNKTFTGRAGNVTAGFYGRDSLVASVDNASIKPLTLSSLFSTVPTSDSDVVVDANVTLTAGTQAGVVLNLDSASSPGNFVIAYHDGTNVKLDKNVGGTYTNLISSAATYSAGATLRVIKDSTKYRVYYNNALVGSEQTISDAGIVSNTIHGLFSTYSGNSFDNFTIWPRGTGGEFASAPFEDLTVTRDTGTTYSSSSGSAKLVAGGTNASFVQSVNVGDTNSYNISGYAYTDGSAVTSSDLELFANGSTVSTTYTSVGSGWYQLTGTVTGVASSVGYGVKVKAGKTVYMDNMSVNNYTSGTLTSSIFDSGQGSNWGTLTFSSTTPSNTSVTVKARSSNDSGMSGATAFSSCTGITSGSDISGNSCITDTHRYIQYQLSLDNSVTTVTPTISDISITFEVSDATAPVVSLTSLDPDPNSDSTPTLTGTATEAVGTVSSVQFQVDSTSGSWSSCTSTDSTFDEASESFSCTTSSLSDGSHTIYIRSTDSNGNVTGSGSYSTDSFTIDTTASTDIALDSPSGDSYTNNQRPVFRWKSSTDATTSVSKYTLTLDNGDTGDITIDNIAVTGTTDIVNDRFVVHFDGFSDSDTTNNYISVYTRSSSLWNSDQNDGKLKEGKRNWRVTATDSAGNTTASSRDLWVDITSPSLTSVSMDNLGEVDNHMVITDTTPSFTGVITDNLLYDKVEVSFNKKVYFLGVEISRVLTDTFTFNLGTTTNLTLSSLTNTFTITPGSSIEYGKYEVSLTGVDKAGNKSAPTTLNLQLVTSAQAKEILKTTDLGDKDTDTLSIPELEKKARLHRVRQAGELERLMATIRTSLNRIYLASINTTGEFGRALAQIFTTINHNLAVVFDTLGRNIQGGMDTIAGLFSGMRERLASVRFNFPTPRLPKLALGIKLPRIDIPLPNLTSLSKNSQDLADRLVNERLTNLKIQSDQLVLAFSRSIYLGAKTLTNSAYLVSVELGERNDRSAARMIEMARRVDSNTNTRIARLQARFNLAFNAGLHSAQKPILAGSGFLNKVKVSIYTVGTIMFDTSPTAITNVTVEEIGKDFAVVSWETNHYAWGKVNYGKTLTYGEEVLLLQREKYHRARLTGLNPNEKYFFEVMSQNGNYVYDAYYTFETTSD